MKVLFIGNVHFSRATLQLLLDLKVNIVGVVTKQNSTFNADHSDLSVMATEAGIPWKYVNNIHHPNNLTWIKTLAPDVIFCFGWSQLLKSEILSLAPMGVVGFHPTLLPRNRGRHPIIWALALGLKETGSSFFFMDEGSDSGDILSQAVIPITPEDDAGTLYEKIISTALTQLKGFIPLLQQGNFSRTPQQSGVANYWRKRGVDDGRIDWRMSSDSIYNLVRALTKPYVGAHTQYKGDFVKIWRVSVVRNVGEHYEPGKILNKEDDILLVKTGDAAVRILSHEFKVLPEIGDYFL